MSELQLHRLTKQYDTHSDSSAVSDLSLTIAAGQITALLGPSGCGKTTTLKLIAGLLRPTAGDILFDGVSVLDVPADRRGAVMVFQNHLLFPHLTALDNVAFGLRMAGVDRATRLRRARAMLDMVQLGDLGARKPGELSGGQAQRVALARALVVQPRVLLLDEPLSNLDAHLRDEMRQLILRIQRQLAVTTIVVTHDQEEAVILADTIALLFGGRLAQVGPPPVFYTAPTDARVARFFGGSNFIPGHWRDGAVETALGRLHLLPQAARQADGAPALLTIRPEHVAPAADVAPDGAPQNVVTLAVTDVVYGGTYARIHLATDAGDQSIELLGAATLAAVCKAGEHVRLYLPPAHLWPLPPNA